jgi:hypothetical protein
MKCPKTNLVVLPGVAPTGRRVEIPLVAIVSFRDGRLAYCSGAMMPFTAQRSRLLARCGMAARGDANRPKLPLLGTHGARGLEDRRPARDLALHELGKGRR